MSSLTNARRKVNQQLVAHSSNIQSLRMAKEQRTQKRQQLQDLLEAQSHAQAIAKGVQQQAHKRIATIVTRCLAAVFDDPYEFAIRFEQKRGRTEARLVFVRNEQEVDPMTASGGGVVDVAAFALRLSCILLSRPPVRRVCVLDEPFKFVSEEYRENVRKLLETLSTELEFQVIMVTHIPEIVTGNVIEL